MRCLSSEEGRGADAAELPETESAGRVTDPAGLCGLTSGVRWREAERTLAPRCSCVLGRHGERKQHEVLNTSHRGAGPELLSG